MHRSHPHNSRCARRSLTAENGPVRTDDVFSDDPPPERQEEFIRLFALTYRSIYSYARTLVSNVADAEDCMQEASLQLWRRFDDFDRNKNFSRWARGFVRRVVKNHHRRFRPRHLALDEELIDRLSAVQGGAQELLELRRERLAHCLACLPVADRALISRYYELEESVTQLAERLDRSPAALYQALRRIRLALFRCADRHLHEGR